MLNFVAGLSTQLINQTDQPLPLLSVLASSTQHFTPCIPERNLHCRVRDTIFSTEPQQSITQCSRKVVCKVQHLLYSLTEHSFHILWTEMGEIMTCGTTEKDE